MNLNKVFILGNLTRDPELRQVPSGQAVCSFGVATNRFFTDSTGQKQQQVEYHNVVAWGRQAEIVNQYLRKGSLVLVEGRLQTRSWDDQAGNKRYRTEIIAERIQLGPRQVGAVQPNGSAVGTQQNNEPSQQDIATPIIDINEGGEEINIDDLPF